MTKSALPLPSPLTDIRAHYTSVRPAVVIPLMQATITGISIGTTAAAVTWAVGAADHALSVGAVASSAALTWQWLAALRDWRSMIWSVEQAAGLDVDGDGYVGAPEPTPVVRVEVVEDNSMRYLDLPCSQSQLETLATGYITLGLGESTWCGKGKTFSKTDYHALRDELIKRNLARWINPESPQQGWEFSVAGRAIMAQIAAQHSPTASTFAALAAFANPLRTRACVRTKKWSVR